MNPEEFINIDDNREIMPVLKKFASAHLSPRERRDALENAGIESSFLDKLKYDLPADSFVLNLLAKIRDFRVSESRLDYHPLMRLLDFMEMFKDIYSLDDREKHVCKMFISRGQENFRILKARSAVVRIESPCETGIGTGVLIRNGLLLTCFHVLNNLSQAWVRFGYYDDSRLEKDWNLYELDLDSIKGTMRPDYALVKIKEPPERSPVSISWEILSSSKEYQARMLHHPGGKCLKISEPGQITQVGENYIDHTIKTCKGSSGAPVFNKKWELTAIHRGIPGTGRTIEQGTTEAVPIRILKEKLAVFIDEE
ncbi:Trypsin-like peptidase domain-containing protein [Desulfonema limicola]|uniref:Serine protease n=1 Tax=Desulfonema limicola TaxID=45656 RepID=A0A975BCN8_9BACT|nr:trypsin-like peptidase domain-containing protein [Desulfonema limicola]QTA82865.1 Trypsin-like peptidase domain-containing protein [Desulfonema limicola]